MKKAGGVYYTPSFVVRHIVRAVLDPLLDGKMLADVSGKQAGASPVRIVDPACGSGRS